MKKLLLFVTLLLLAAVSFGAAPKTAKDTLAYYRTEGPYGLSAVPPLYRWNLKAVFVDSAATNASDSDDGIHGETWDTPYATIDYAIGEAAGRAVILVAPTHTETISTADGLDVDVAGTYILGLGEGSYRPTITMDTDNVADCNIAAVNCTLDNLRFINGVEAAEDSNGLTQFIEVTADYATIRRCFFGEGGTGLDANGLSAITLGTADNNADFATVELCEFYLPNTTNWNQAIDFAKDHAGIRIANNFIWGDFSEAGIDIPTGGNAQVGLAIVGNEITNTEAGDHALQANGTGNTGYAVGNLWCTNAAATAVDAGGIALAGNFTSLYAVDQDFDEDPNGMPMSQ